MPSSKKSKTYLNKLFLSDIDQHSPLAVNARNQWKANVVNATSADWYQTNGEVVNYCYHQALKS